MINNEKIILLEDKIPLRLIQEPNCKKCMNPVNEGVLICDQCAKAPPGFESWFFNRIISLGNYITLQNDPYNKIPVNVISRMILTIKGSVKKPKNRVGNLIADGLFQMLKKYPFLIENTSFMVVPPKNNRSEENQCDYFLKPLIKRLKDDNIPIKDLSNNLIRKRDIGKMRDKQSAKKRFNDIKNVHEFKLQNLNGAKILILDDIITSKSTIWDISRALKEKNAGEINVLSVGRTYFGSGEVDLKYFLSDLNFDELMTFFSNLNNFLDPKNIDNVKIKQYSCDQNRVRCDLDKYEILINFDNRVLKHKCVDFERRRYKNKSFCKHLSKVFLKIKEEKGEIMATQLLNKIYANLLDWEFKID